jgi:hypothetical protein
MMRKVSRELVAESQGDPNQVRPPQRVRPPPGTLRETPQYGRAPWWPGAGAED